MQLIINIMNVLPRTATSTSITLSVVYYININDNYTIYIFLAFPIFAST